MSKISERYQKLASIRSHHLAQARAAAALTMPGLLPSEDSPDPAQVRYIEQPFTGIGQSGTANFAAKLVLALMPPGENSFRYQIDEVERLKRRQQLQISGASPEDIAKDEDTFDAGLLALEQSTVRDIEALNDRVRVFELVLHLIIAGNALAYIGEKAMRVYHLNQYVLVRHSQGPPREAIIHERVRCTDLPEKAWAQLREQYPDRYSEQMRIDETVVDLYTEIKWGKARVSWSQLVDDVVVLTGRPSPVEAPEWVASRMYHTSGQDYSPGFIEKVCMADLQQANLLDQAISEGSLLASQVKFARDPNAQTSAAEFVSTKNGGVFTGKATDIVPVVFGKSSDFRTATERLAVIEQRLRNEFMMLQVRDSERTTREEVQATVLELQQRQASIYAILTAEFQVPYIQRRLSLLTGGKRLPSTLSGLVRPVVSAGLAAVGRSAELEKYRAFLGVARENFGEEVVTRMLDTAFALRRMAASLNILTPGLVKSDKDIAAEAEQARADQIRNATLTAGMGDPQKLANAAVTAADAGLITQDEQQPQEPMQ